MINEAMLCDILPPLLDNINDSAAHIYSEYADLDGNNRICGPG